MPAAIGDSTIVDIRDASDTEYVSSATPKGESREVDRSSLAPVGVTLRWEDVHLQVNVKDEVAKEMKTKTILHKISGKASPGELLAIMGPSGAGKSSLLDCLAGRNAHCTGNITINGKPWSKELGRISAYVLQDDLFYHSLSVREHLTFQAALRMGTEFTKEQQARRVDRVIDELGLNKCRDTMIGNENVRGISGGERKRLSFASELLTNPSILFVDEPTSGLDSFMAETVVLQLQALAREGRTIVATIHQPSSELFGLFDKLLLLSEGKLMFHDDAAKAVDYFASIGYSCPTFTNPSDYFMRQLANRKNEESDFKRINALHEAWSNSSKEHDLKKTATQSSNEQLELNELTLNSKPLNLLFQFEVLCRRNVRRLIKDKLAFAARVGQNVVMALIVGLIYLQLDTDQQGVQNFSGALFFLTVNRVFGDASPEFMIFPLELPIVVREHRAGLYKSYAWFLAKNISELPFQVFIPLIFLVPTYLLIGFGGGLDIFLQFAGIICLLSSCATGLGYFVACICGKPQIASIVGPVIILPFLLFGGLFLNSDDAPSYFLWLQFISPIKYGYEALMMTFWNTVDEISCDDAVDGKCNFKTGQDVLDFYSFNDRSVATNVLILFALNLGFRFIASLALARYLRRSQK